MNILSFIGREISQIFLWFWFVFIGAMTVVSVFVWLKRLIFQRARRRFIGKFLKYLDGYGASHDSDKRVWHAFVDKFLRVDGVYVVHLVGDKAGEIVAGDIVCHMWMHFRALATGAALFTPQTATAGVSSFDRLALAKSQAMAGQKGLSGLSSQGGLNNSQHAQYMQQHSSHRSPWAPKMNGLSSDPHERFLTFSRQDDEM